MPIRDITSDCYIIIILQLSQLLVIQFEQTFFYFVALDL